jgi:transposase-like protein
MTGRNVTQRKPQLDTRQMRAIELYAQGSTDAEVATELGVERSTVWRWRTQDRTFRSTLRRVHAEATGAGTARLESLVERALDVIASTLADERVPPAVRLRAAEAVLARTGIESNDNARIQAVSPLADILDPFGSE